MKAEAGGLVILRVQGWPGLPKTKSPHKKRRKKIKTLSSVSKNKLGELVASAVSLFRRWFQLHYELRTRPTSQMRLHDRHSKEMKLRGPPEL